DFPRVCIQYSCRLLDDLITMGASHFYKYYVEEIKRGILYLPSNEGLTATIELIKHYHNHSTLSRATFNAVTPSLSNGELMTLLSQCPFLPDQLRMDVEAELQHESHRITINVKTLTGKVLTLSVDLTPRTVVFVIKKMIQDCERIPWDLQRLIFSGRRAAGKEIIHYDALTKR
ncbi:hypothetical protein PFISCL1PPCAC_21825, partial [Pristionchus fissidentatus]